LAYVGDNPIRPLEDNPNLVTCKECSNKVKSLIKKNT